VLIYLNRKTMNGLRNIKHESHFHCEGISVLTFGAVTLFTT